MKANNEKKIYLNIWNPDTDTEEWREFAIDEIDELYEMEIIDEDMIGAAMNEDLFDKTMQRLEGKTFTMSQIVSEYMEIANINELRIR